MTFKRPAYEQVTIAHGGSAVTLRPTLRAATILEDKFGFPAIDKGLAELDFIIVSEIILAASCSRQDAAVFLSVHPERPLSPFFEAVIDPLSDLVRMFIPAPVQRRDKAQPATGERMTFAEMFETFFDTATGFLEWTPEEAWNATPTEINRAYAAHMNKLKAINGTGEDDKQPTKPDAYNTERMEQIDKQGFDPAFDRDRLRALKMKIASGS